MTNPSNTTPKREQLVTWLRQMAHTYVRLAYDASEDDEDGAHEDIVQKTAAWLAADYILALSPEGGRSEEAGQGLERAIRAMERVTIFVTSKERIKHPEGTNWWQAEILHAKLSVPTSASPPQPSMGEKS